MELGITIPLQRFLKRKKPDYGGMVDLLFCWDLHNITYQGQDVLLVVNASNRFTCVMANLRRDDWENLEETAKKGIEAGLLAEGFDEETVRQYFIAAGEPWISKTHGRRPVAALNRAVERLFWMGEPLIEESWFQKNHSNWVNEEICKVAGFSLRGTPREFLQSDMAQHFERRSRR